MKTTLQDVQDCLDEAFDGDYKVVRTIPHPVEQGLVVMQFVMTSKAEREGTEIPFEIAKKHLHCGGCSYCQGMPRDE